MNDRMKIRILKGLLVLTVADLGLAFYVVNKQEKQLKKLIKDAVLKFSVIQSFVDECEDRPDIIFAVYKKHEFDWIVKDLDL